MARPHGYPTWIEYSASGLDPSLAFYERLAGWSFPDLGEETRHYRVASAPGGEVAGLMDTTGVPCPEGEVIPPHWDVYLAVDSVDATIEAVHRAGGEVAVGPRDVPGRGRMAIVVDPTGSPVGIWEAHESEGFVLDLTPGTPVWFEIMSTDVAATRSFYTEVFGFDYVAMPGSDRGGEPGYFTNGPLDGASSGLCDASAWFPAGTTSFWRWYLSVPDLDAALATVAEHGGSVLDGPIDSPFGRVATVRDPAGASLQIVDTSAATEDA